MRVLFLFLGGNDIASNIVNSAQHSAKLSGFERRFILTATKNMQEKDCHLTSRYHSDTN